MGFFDDLDQEVGGLAEDTEVKPVASDYDPVLQQLRGGWTKVLRRAEPMSSKSVAGHFQEVEVRYDGDRFLWITRLREKRGRTTFSTLSEDQRRLDDQALVDAFIDNPWVGQACLDAVGVDLSRPDF